MTVWDADGKPSHDPLAILEWKVGQKKGRQADIGWLSAYFLGRPRFVGFSVVCALGPPVVLDVALIQSGKVKPEWLNLPHQRRSSTEK
jgi:hypothetical protein